MTTPNSSFRNSLVKKFAAALVATTVLGVGISGFTSATTSPAAADAVHVQAPTSVPSFADLIEKVSPAVVSVRVKSDIQPAASSNFSFNGQPFDNLPEDSPLRKFFRDFGPQFGGPDGQGMDRGGQQQQRLRRPRPVAQGSGFFISGDGYVVTNNHVVDSGDQYTVLLNDGTELPAKLVGTDPRTDLAVLKVDQEKGKEFTYVGFADDSKVRVGDWVVAVGNPFGLGGTVTAGIVSARGRDIGAGPYDDFIQIDAAVNHGNSGGPTFDLSGQVVGINTAIYSPSGGNVGIAFAVPASTAKDVVKQLIDKGSVERGWLGVAIQTVTPDIAESLGIKDARGALVAESQGDTPAEKAGIKSGDVIIAVNGQPVKDPRGLSRAIAAMDPGTKVDITLLRRGKEQKITVTLGEFPKTETASAAPDTQQQAAPTALANLGMTVAPADDGSGVVVTAVEPDSAAADAGIPAGAKILQVDNEDVTTAADVEKAFEKVASSGRKAALVLLDVNDTSRFVAVPVDQG